MYHGTSPFNFLAQSRPVTPLYSHNLHMYMCTYEMNVVVNILPLADFFTPTLNVHASDYLIYHVHINTMCV